MKIKLYKKRVHWYYTYNSVEYRIEENAFLDALSQFYDKTELTFTIKQGPSTTGLFIYRTDGNLKYSKDFYNLAKLLHVRLLENHPLSVDIIIRMKSFYPYDITNIE